MNTFTPAEAAQIRKELADGTRPYDLVLAGRVYVRELGTSGECARKGCTRDPRWRIIHGHWNMQSWVCRQHVPWGLELEQLSDNRGRECGFEVGYVDISPQTRKVYSRTIKVPSITPAMGQVTQYGRPGGRVLDYGRDVSDEIVNKWTRNGGVSLVKRS